MNVAIIQVRMGSTRFPGKVLKKIQDKTILEIIVERLSKCVNIDRVVIASSNLNADKPIWELCENRGYDLYKGDELDVLDRVYCAALTYQATTVLRITGDCPLVDSDSISALYDFFVAKNLDHAGLLTGAGAAKTVGNRFPDGLDAEWMKFSALKEAADFSTTAIDREHVTSFIWRNENRFHSAGLASQEDFSDVRVTVDTPEDLEMLQTYCKEFSISGTQISFREIAKWIRSQSTPPKSQEFIGKENYDLFYGQSK
jgi:spore coat polysaccharide biosynthesis protein SpsF